MNVLQMIAVLILLALLLQTYFTYIGVPSTYYQVFLGLAMLKGVALFLIPERAPIVMVKKTKEEIE